MKKIIALVLALVMSLSMVMSLAACGEPSPEEELENALNELAEALQ